MTDIHCHILPGVDDGAETMEDALAMAVLAAGCGLRDIIATPHVQGRAGELDKLSAITQGVERLNWTLARERIPLDIHPGAEILCLPETVELARQRRLPTLGNTNYVLCEFFFDAPYEFMDRILEGIGDAGYRIVVAHPERYETVIRDPRCAGHWFRQGYVIQLDKGSVLGAFGGRVQSCARWLLDMGFVHLIASDAHSPRRRTTDLSFLRSWLLERYPEGYVELLLEENPRRLLHGRDMVPTERN